MSFPGIVGGPPPPPPPPLGSLRHDISVPVLPQINIPKPRSKMKTLQWQKIPVNNVIGKANIWTIIGRLEKKYEMDYEKMDELFSLNHESGPKRSSQDTDGVPDHKRKKENTEGVDRLNVGEINILDGKRSLNVNIFLKHFRMEHEEIVQLVREGRCEKFGAERLRSLLKLLPSQEEIDAINAFDGDINKLGNAEKFFICLMKLPNYRMRIEGLLIMEEFNVNMEWIRPSIESVIQAAKDIEENQSLKELIYLILISGNYLNSGNYAGNAAGFKLSSLLKLTEIRANKPKMNLMHYVAQEAEEKSPKLLRFPDEMTFLKDAAQVSLEALTTDINNIASKVRAITEQIVVAGTDFQQQMAFFLKAANVEVVELEEDLKDIDKIKQELATFFCEDIKIFRLEECFKILQTFCERLKKATEENVQRRIQEDKAERRRTSKESKSYRTSKDASELSDQSFEHSNKKDESSVVDMLLADVRSGFATRKFNDGNFSVTKVTKVNLNSADADVTSIDSPVNGSSPTPDSHSQRRSRKSYATEDNESLIDYLKENSCSEAPAKPMPQFDRYATLRRRRLERKAKQSVLEAAERDRERSSSPSGITIQSTPIDTSVSDIQMRHNNDNVTDRSKSETYSTSNDSRKLQRSKSWLDRPSADKASIEQRRRELKDDTDETDALIRRIKQRLSKRDGRNTPPISEEGDGNTLRTNLTSSHQDATPMTRRSSRIQSGISENSSPLEKITETNFKMDDFLLTSKTNTKDIQMRSKMSDQFRNIVSPHELDAALQNTDNSSSTPKHSQNVMVSMRKKISSGMGTDIDGVLKTIEDTGRQIDTIGVTGPIKRTPDPNVNTNQSQPQVSVVAHVTASNIPEAPVCEQELKAKRDKRKKRSTLSVDDVKAAMKLSSSIKVPEGGISRNLSLKSKISSSHTNNSTSTAKTPPIQRRPRSNSDKTDGEKVVNDDGGNGKDLNKAAKLAARKKFRDARFGVSCTSDINSLRARSNVESDSVDQALKELKCQSGMSRSKSYDEHVAKKFLSGEGDFTSNNIMRMNSGSAPDTSAEKSAVMRNSINRLSMDGRRNGLYIPSDESDTELKPEDLGTRRSSKSDSPKRFSQLSLKSVNTSTETLPAEIEPSAEQSIKRMGFLSHKDMHNNDSLNKNVRSNTSFPSQTTVKSNTYLKEHSTLGRSYSLMERHKNNEEESESPLAAVAQWKMRRVQQRRSVYDNMYENNVSESTPNALPSYVRHLKSEENDLKNEAGSRSSYASSNDKDEGFETSSGTVSQRTSMNSNFEAEMHNTPTISRRTESHRCKENVENWTHKSVINAAHVNHSVISRLSEEANRKERTENWTEQTVRVNGDSRTDTKGEFHNALSVESEHNTSKEGIWKDEAAFSSSKSLSAPKQMVTSTPSKKIPTAEDATKLIKPKAVPSYMLPTNSSANKPIRNKLPLTSKTDTTASTPTFTRNTSSRTSDRNLESTPVFKRDTVRASMRAETAASSFQRGTAARTSIRGPRTSPGSSKSFLSPPGSGRTRSDSNASASSIASGTSNISATPSSVSEATRRRLAPTSNTGTPIHGPTSPSSRPTTPSITHKSPVHQSHTSPTKGIVPASHIKMTATPTSTSSGFTRSHSMRVTSGRTSLGGQAKHSNPTPIPDGRRSVTPMIDKSPNRIHLPERPQSTTPFSSEDKSARRSSFMAPTASSKAKVDEQTPVAPPRTKSLHVTQNLSPFSRSASLRMPKNVSGRESPAPTENSSFHHRLDHDQSLSTVTEQVGDEDKEDISKKPASIFKRLSSANSKVSTGVAKTPKKSPNIIFTKK